MKVKIYQPSKTPTQSGQKQKPWTIEIVQDENDKSIDNIMGWTSSNSTLMQLKLQFQNSEDAVKYAVSQGWKYEVIKPKEAAIQKKSYAENFQ